jgi:hypothetical protein
MILMVWLKRKTGLRLLVAFAFFLFTVSVFCPFLQVQWQTASRGSDYFWSFKETYESVNSDGFVVVGDDWFDWYWDEIRFRDKSGPWIHHSLILMLGAQVFTFFFAGLAILDPDPILLLPSTVLTVFAIFCMLFLYNVFSRSQVTTFEAGFWLLLLSVPLFIAALLLSWKQP